MCHIQQYSWLIETSTGTVHFTVYRSTYVELGPKCYTFFDMTGDLDNKIRNISKVISASESIREKVVGQDMTENGEEGGNQVQ